MKSKYLFTTIGVVLIAAFLTFQIIRCTHHQEKAEVDLEALAQKLVVECCAIHEGDFVLVSGGVRDMELLENIAVNVRKQGAFPLVTIGSDRMTRRMWTDVPEKYDSQLSAFDFELYNLITADISVDFSETVGQLADIPPERLAARSKANEPISDLFYERNIRGVNLGNGLYPTAALADLFDVSQDELVEIFWSGVNVDYTELQTTGETVKAVLETGKEVHITNPNGTDLKVRIEGRPVFVSDGVVSADDIQRGGPACQVYLPAGEVYLAPIVGTAEGQVVVDRQFFQGKEILGLTLVFKEGKLTSMSAQSGLEPLKVSYDAYGSGKELFGVIDVGINPNVNVIPGSKILTWMPAGMVTVVLGSNTWAGGDNNINFGLTSFLPGCTLEVDEKVLVENGVLKL
ncbi:aminopeptidase [bacterium]|nr:aminopeptidase [bacterium]